MLPHTAFKHHTLKQHVLNHHVRQQRRDQAPCAQAPCVFALHSKCGYDLIHFQTKPVFERVSRRFVYVASVFKHRVLKPPVFKHRVLKHLLGKWLSPPPKGLGASPPLKHSSQVLRQTRRAKS